MQRPVLNQNGCISYPDPALFCHEVPEIERTAGILVETRHPPPMRSSGHYQLTVRGETQTVELDAEVVYVTDGLAGLQILNLDHVRPALDELCARLAGAAAREQAAAPPAPAPEPAPAPPFPAVPAVAPAPAPPVAAQRPRVAGQKARFEFTGKLLPLTSLDDMIGPEALQPDAPLTAVQALLSAARRGEECTVHFGTWRVLIGRRGQLMGLFPEDGEGVLAELRRSRELPNETEEALLRETQGAPGVAEALAVRRGILVVPQLNAGLRRLLHRRAGEIVRCYGGTYRVSSGFAVPPVAAVAFETAGVEILRHGCRSLPPAALYAYFEQRQCLAPGLVPAAEEKLHQLGLLPRDERFLRRFDGILPLQELLRQCPMAKETLYELLFCLEHTGLCTLQRASGTSEITPEQELEAWWARIHGGGPFDVLELHWTAHIDELRARLRQRRVELAPAGLLARFSPRARELSQRILESVENACQQLESPTKRLAARKEAAGAGNILMVRDVLMRHAELAQLRGDEVTVRRCADVLKEIQTL
jgi:hypothetical protein